MIEKFQQAVFDFYVTGTPNRYFIFSRVILGQQASMWQTELDKEAYCHLSFVNDCMDSKSDLLNVGCTDKCW